MNRTQKTTQIGEVKDRFDRAISVALLDFQGLSVETVTALRRAFRKEGIEYKVVKNTIIRHALKESPYKHLAGDLDPKRTVTKKAHEAVRGMTGVAWSYEDPAAPAKIVQAFKKANSPKADKLKVNLPVIVNLQNVDRDLSRRIIDFASGLCYGVGGQMERVANNVFLLTPANVEVSADDRRRLEERGYGEG